jgi:hypothetical protein
MTTLLYSYIDAPTLEKETVDKIVNDLYNFQGQSIGTKLNFDQSYLHRVFVKEGETFQGNTQKTIRLDDSMVQWAKKNIGSKCLDVRASYTTTESKYHSAHVDPSRDWAAIYVIKNGGPANKTCFYFDNSLEKLIPENRNYFQERAEHLETIAELQIPEGRWVLLNGRALHGVEEIPNGRIIIHASFDNISDLKLRHPIYYHEKVSEC